MNNKLQEFKAVTPHYIALFNQVLKGESISKALSYMKLSTKRIKEISAHLESAKLPFELNKRLGNLEICDNGFAKKSKILDFTAGYSDEELGEDFLS